MKNKSKNRRLTAKSGKKSMTSKFPIAFSAAYGILLPESSFQGGVKFPTGGKARDHLTIRC